MRDISTIQDELDTWEEITNRASDLLDLAKSGDESFRSELSSEFSSLSSQLERLELETLLGGPYDKGNALLSINAGAGGTDAQDWGEMLMRMYLRWAEQNGYTTDVINMSPGEEAGIKSITILIGGKYAFGYLHAEKAFTVWFACHHSMPLTEGIPLSFRSKCSPRLLQKTRPSRLIQRISTLMSINLPVRPECAEKRNGYPYHAPALWNCGILPE